MAARVTTQGLGRCGKQTFESTNYNAAREVQTFSVDDSAVAIAATDTAANSGGAVTNFFDKARTSTPTEGTSGSPASATTTLSVQLTTAEAIYTIKRILLHDDIVATVTSSTTTLWGGIDAQTLAHTADFTMTITVVVTWANKTSGVSD